MAASVPQVAVVTGASSGIGLGVAKSLHASGWIVFCGARTLARLEDALAEERARDAARVVPAVGDVATEEGCRAVVEAVRRGTDRVDLLVNCAGGARIGAKLDATSTSDFDWHYALNVRSVFLVTTGLSTLFVEGSSVVNVSSIAAIRATPGLGAYCVAKAAVDHLTSALALEWAPRKIRVNAVRPATVVTNFHRAGGMAEPTIDSYYGASGASVHPVGRVGEVEDIVRAIRFLHDSPWATGTNITLDGGRTLVSAVAPGLTSAPAPAATD